MIVSKLFNTITAKGFGTANKWAAGSLVFGFTGKTIDFLAEEELSTLSNF